MELPQLVDPSECLESEQVLEGAVSSDQFERLSEQVCRPSADIRYKLSFNQDDSKRCIVKCELTGRLNVICQRCGTEMALPIETSSELCIISDDRLAEGLPRRYEPLVSTEGMISPLEVIEEELLLAIPMIPRHEEMECPINLSNDLVN